MAEAPADLTLPSPDGDSQFTLLQTLIQQINRESSLESVFALLADTLRQIFGINRFAVALLQEDGTLRLTASHGLSASYLDVVRRRIDEGAGARALAERKPLYIPDAATGDAFWPFGEAARQEGFHTVLIWPLFGLNLSEGIPEPLGYLIMYHDEIRQYTPAEISLAQALVQQAAFAVQNARLLQTAELYRAELEERFRRRVAEAEAIDDIVLRISSSLDLGSTLQSIVDAAASLSGSPYSSIYLRDSLHSFRAMAAHGVPLDRLQRVVLTDSEGLIAEMVRTGEPVEVTDFPHDVQRSTSAAREEVERTGARATLGVPLMQGIDCVGALYVAGTEAAHFSADTVRTLRRLASFAQVALQNAQRFSSVEADRSRLLTQLLDFSARLNSSLTLSTLLDRVVEAAMSLVGARTGMIGLLEDDCVAFHRLRRGDEWIDVDLMFRRGEGVPGYVWDSGVPYVANRVETDPHVVPRHHRELGFRRLVTVPLVDHAGVLIGMIEVQDPVVERDFGQMDVEALQMLAHQASIAIENVRLNESKDEFLSIVSHELKTPVTSIKGFAQVLQRRMPPESTERSSRYLEVINHQADRLTALINDLLDLSRIQTGRFVFEMERFDYGHLVQDVVAEMQLIASHNPIRLESPERVIVRGNAHRLRQVLVNLIDNAVKHGPPQSTVRVTVELHDGEVATCVSDEGEGLPPAEVEQIFRPYYQIRQHGRGQPKGLGLGLFISRQIVTEHGGRIWAETSDRTSFCFNLPHVG